MPPSCKRGSWGRGSKHLTWDRARKRRQWISGWANKTWNPKARPKVLRFFNSLQWASRKKLGDSSGDQNIVMEARYHLGSLSMSWAHRQSSAPWWGVGENNKVIPAEPWPTYPCRSAGLWIPALPIPPDLNCCLYFMKLFHYSAPLLGGFTHLTFGECSHRPGFQPHRLPCYREKHFSCSQASVSWSIK